MEGSSQLKSLLSLKYSKETKTELKTDFKLSYNAGIIFHNLL
jgi:hypothetical protein